ncbi:MAG: MFS transporter [Ignavibacteria bacterium]|nr:MAG: MFS transporter [Ignavibacteria bacterium]
MLGIQQRLTKSFYALLSLPATAMGFALSIQIAALSWILNTQYGLDIHEIGIVWAAGPLAGIFGQVIIGVISDRVWFWGGRRRPFILIGGVLAALMLIALPNIHHISSALGFGGILGVAMAVALTLDLAINISFNPTRSIIADVTPEGNARTKGYTWMQTISGFFGVAAYALGATLGNYVLIYLGAVVVLLFSLFPPLFIQEDRDLSDESATDDDEHAKDEHPTDWNQLLRIYFAHAFSWLGIQTMFVYIIAYINQKLSPATDFETGQIISISFLILNTVGFILPVLVLEPLAERMGRVRVHMAAVAVMALAYLGIVLLGKTTLSLYVLMAFAGVGWAAVVSLPFAIMSENVNKSRMGFFMGIFNLSVVLPQLVVSLGLGIVILNAADKNLIFIISAVSLGVSALLWLLVREPQTSHLSEK